MERVTFTKVKYMMIQCTLEIDDSSTFPCVEARGNMAREKYATYFG